MQNLQKFRNGNYAQNIRNKTEVRAVRWYHSEKLLSTGDGQGNLFYWDIRYSEDFVTILILQKLSSVSPKDVYRQLKCHISHSIHLGWKISGLCRRIPSPGICLRCSYFGVTASVQSYPGLLDIHKKRYYHLGQGGETTSKLSTSYFGGRGRKSSDWTTDSR